MGATTVGASGLALAFVGSMEIPNYTAIGSGSGAVAISRTDLIAQTGSQTFSAIDISTPRFVSWTSDFGATQMSGTNLTEFGLKSSDGTLFVREGFGSVVFDGTNELQIELTLEVYASGA